MLSYWQKQLDAMPKLKMINHTKRGKISVCIREYNNNNTCYFNTLVNESAVKNFGLKDHPVKYKNTYMRSKLEMLVAEVLDSLNLEYRYEPLIYLGKEGKFSDFFIHLPAINRCFPTEVAGKLEETNYSFKFLSDMQKYLSEGYLINRNLLIIGETTQLQINTELIGENICDFVNSQVHEALMNIKN